MSFTLVGGRVLDPASGIDKVADVAVDATGRISGIGTSGEGRRIDIAGCWVLPGLVDIGT